MERRGTKRKHSEIVHEGLAFELTKLNNDSAKLNSDMKLAKEDFALMCKSMTDRQAEILTARLFLEEQYRYFTFEQILSDTGISFLLRVFL